VLAIAALLYGKFFGGNRLDAAVGMLGSIVIMRWAVGLLKETAPILLDGSAKGELLQQIGELVGAEMISDLHVWKVGPHDYSVILSLVTDTPQSPDFYKQKLSAIPHLSHITVEINSPSA
jgi:Co/Zn/Cd efflux system component